MPHSPFGFGLSYTRFSMTRLCIREKEGRSPCDVAVTVTVTNEGLVKGKEVMQVYIDGVLKGFRKVVLEPGENQEVDIFLENCAFSE